MINLEKDGTIILSRYRSGGTQLKTIIETYYNFSKINCKYLGEFDINFEDDVKNQIDTRFKTENFKKIILLNNSLSISLLYHKNYFDNLTKRYNIIVLNRKNKENNLLSLPLWEYLIQENLYDYEGDDLKIKMKLFHENLLKNPIKYTNVYLGHHVELRETDPYHYLNTIIRLFISEWSQIQNIKNLYNLPQIHYEDFEFSTQTFVENNFENVNNSNSYIFNYTNKKIPYFTNEFKIYFDTYTQEILKIWNLNSCK